MSEEKIKYFISEDGKSIYLWRTSKYTVTKIARFRSKATARIFAEEFNFPLSGDC